MYYSPGWLIITLDDDDEEIIFFFSSFLNVTFAYFIDRPADAKWLFCAWLK